MLTEDDNLVVFESLRHAGPLVHDLKALGIPARMVSMPFYAIQCLSGGMDLGLRVLRHSGAIPSIDEVVIQ